MTTEQTIQDVAMIARNGIDRVIELGKRLAARLDEDDWGYIEPFLNECETELESLRQQLAECQATNWKLREALDAVQQVANSSEGIAGWHLNGDIASWDSILPEVDEALALPNDATALSELIAERTASLTAEVERLKDCWSAEGAQVDTLRQQNAELTAQRDALLAFAASYIAAWNNGSTGDSDIFFMAESAIANCKEPGK